MSDIQEPIGLARARMEEKLSEFQLSLKRLTRRRFELQYEMDKLAENETATRAAMAAIEANLK